LTFDAHGTTTNEGYQGVFFKWGSLVGVSPAQTNNGDPDIDDDHFLETTPVYAPDGSGGWTITTYSDWENIPYWKHGLYGDVIDDEDQIIGVGDICRYLNSAYRLPTINEFGTSYANWDSTNPTTVPVDGGWVRSSGWPSSFANVVATPNGQADLIGAGLGYAKNVTMDNLMLLASGYRHYTDFSLGGVGNLGYYWGGSADGSDYAHVVRVNGNGHSR
jgi:hypothetical protein